jgi:hypothetical protein
MIMQRVYGFFGLAFSVQSLQCMRCVCVPMLCLSLQLAFLRTALSLSQFTFCLYAGLRTSSLPSDGVSMQWATRRLYPTDGAVRSSSMLWLRGGRISARSFFAQKQAT